MYRIIIGLFFGLLFMRANAVTPTGKIKCWPVSVDPLKRTAYVCDDAEKPVSVKHQEKKPHVAPNNFRKYKCQNFNSDVINNIEPNPNPSITKTTSAIPTNKPEPKISYGHPYLGVIAGVGIAKIDKSQLDTTQGKADGASNYISTADYREAVLYGINGGYEFKFKSHGLISLGLGIYQNSNYTSKGERWYIDYEGPNEHYNNYEYKLQSTRVMFETQLAWEIQGTTAALIPFVSLGIGSAFNYANGYQETLVDATDLSSGFGTHVTTSLAYQVGGGFAVPFNANQDRFSLAYRYAYLGKAHFNSRGTNDSTYMLDVGKVRAHEAYISYTHFFNF